MRGTCIYDYFYNSAPPEGAGVLRKQSDIPRPFVFDPPRGGLHPAGSRATFRLTLLGRGIDYMPYFLLALRNLGETGMSKGYRKGYGRFSLESVDSVGYSARAQVFSGDTVFSNAIRLSYQQILEASVEHSGCLTLRFLTPTQIKENDRFTAAPTFRGLISRLLFRANAMAEFYGSGILYNNDGALELLGGCRAISIAAASTRGVRAGRYFHRQRIRMQQLPPFFEGEVTYCGDFSRDMMALLELGRLIHVGKMATFGNGMYMVEAE
ncbi:MAG: CRISPR system precrRNA processing endoribonuclease RAMP protein Cas6 [Methanothrix sp.]|nr:CRISPR system precrRNA processing endoribonuclease RAMP protein Cas6 [Methanothrix sp.]